MSMTYLELVDHLLNKYGHAQCDYFLSEKCTSKNKKVTRTSEGLLCHHIDENICDDLSEPSQAASHSFEYQKAGRLVYCNYIEHLLLHIQIGKDRYWEKYAALETPSQLSYFLTSGVVYLCRDINELYDSQGCSTAWKNRCYQEIKENMSDYIFILKSLFLYLDEHYTGDDRAYYIGKKLKTLPMEKELLQRLIK